jgi:hypothetical protein
MAMMPVMVMMRMLGLDDHGSFFGAGRNRRESKCGSGNSCQGKGNVAHKILLGCFQSVQAR